MDSSFRLRPMDTRDILDDTFDLYKENFILLATITAVIFLPLNLFLVFFSRAPYTYTPGRPPDMSVAGPFIVMQMLGGVLTILASIVVTGALTKGISERYLGHRVTLREAYEAINRRFGAFMVTLFLPFFLFIGGSVLFIAVGAGISVGLYYVNPILGGIMGFLFMVAFAVAIVFFSLSLTFVMPVFVVEQLSAWAAIKRSFVLYRFSPGKVIGTMFLVNLIVGLVQTMIMVPMVGIFAMGTGPGNPLRPLFLSLQGATTGVVQSLFQPIAITVLLLLYYDVRIRKEGFDLEMMANDLQTSIDPSLHPVGPGETPAATDGGEPPVSLP